MSNLVLVALSVAVLIWMIRWYHRQITPAPPAPTQTAGMRIYGNTRLTFEQMLGGLVRPPATK